MAIENLKEKFEIIHLKNGDKILTVISENISRAHINSYFDVSFALNEMIGVSSIFNITKTNHEQMEFPGKTVCRSVSLYHNISKEVLLKLKREIEDLIRYYKSISKPLRETLHYGYIQKTISTYTKIINTIDVIIDSK